MSLITQNSGSTRDYTDWSIMTFPDWRSLEEFAQKVPMTGQALLANREFAGYIDNQLRNLNNNKFNSYGLNDKHPRNYQEAMNREKFTYYEEYKKIKDRVERIVAEKLRKSSVAEVMKPKFVFNDKIGEFNYDKAAMMLVPEQYFYSPSKKREIDANKEKIIYKGEKMYLEDNTEVVFAFKVQTGGDIKYELNELGLFQKKTKKIDGQIFNEFSPSLELVDVLSGLKGLGYEVRQIDEKIWAKKNKESRNGKYEYVVVDGEESLRYASSIGVIEVTSDVKKVYLYKEKKPKLFNSVKIIVGLTAGGFTQWTNDFYTGVTAGIITDVLEGLGYSVAIEIAVGGGRCGGCYRKLNFEGRRTHGRRFFTFTAKSFNQQLDKDGLLYTLCDPSFHNIKFIRLLNSFFSFFGDEVDTRGNPAGTWHGISDNDMMFPIGVYHKSLDFKKGNSDLMHFYIHQVKDEGAAIAKITDIALMCENINKEALEKFMNYDFGTA